MGLKVTVYTILFSMYHEYVFTNISCLLLIVQALLSSSSSSFSVHYNPAPANRPAQIVTPPGLRALPRRSPHSKLVIYQTFLLRKSENDTEKPPIFLVKSVSL
jgi:hypothetical protein